MMRRFRRQLTPPAANRLLDAIDEQAARERDIPASAGPYYLGYQCVYVTGVDTLDVLRRAMATVETTEVMYPGVKCVGFVLEQYDGVAAQENGHGCVVTLTFDSDGKLSKAAVGMVAKQVGQS